MALFYLNAVKSVCETQKLNLKKQNKKTELL